MLSKEIQDQINKEAKEYSAGWGVNNDAEAYQSGAEKWAVWKQKAEGYEKALREIIRLKSIALSTQDLYPVLQEIDKAEKALEQFK